MAESYDPGAVLELPRDAPLPSTIQLRSTLRVLPGRRETVEGIWGGEAVIVKRLYPGARARRGMNRERAALSELQARGIAAPRLLYAGRLRDGSYVLITRKIGQGRTLREEFTSRNTLAEKNEILQFFLTHLAEVHAKGVEQQDLHLGNYIYAGEQLWLLDPAQVVFHRQAVPPRKALSQLALVLSQRCELDAMHRRGLTEKYFSVRGWTLTEKKFSLVERKLERHRHRNLKRFLRKCLRENSRHTSVQEGPASALADRHFAAAVTVGAFCGNVEYYMRTGISLKDGGTSALVRTHLAGWDVVVKRYNHKGLVHSLRHTIKGTRARRSWLNAHRLHFFGIATPRPLALIEFRRWGVVHTSYIVTEFVGGRPLRSYLENPELSRADKSRVAERVVRMLEALKTHKLNHNDLKQSNILIEAGEPVLVDLDTMRMYRSRILFKRRWQKDWARFQKNWADSTALQLLFSEASMR